MTAPRSRPAQPAAASKRPRRRRALRFVLAALAVLAAAELAYLAAANLLLATPLLRSMLDRRPEKRLVEWERAWTVVPGRVHLRGFRLRVQNRPAQWLLTLDRATATLDLPALAGRRFHVVSLDADGASFRLRRRLDTPPDSRVPDEATPPIPGLVDPPDPPPEELHGHRGGHGWRIDLDRVAVTGVREIWIGQHRLTGDGRLTGSLALWIRRSLALEEMRLHLAAATLQTGGETVADRLDADLRARLEPLDPTAHRGREKLRFLSARVDLRGRVVDLGRLIEAPRRDEAPWLALGGGGDLAARVALERGVIAAGSHLAVDAPRLAVDYLGYHAEGAGRLIARVAEAHAEELGAADESPAGERPPRDGRARSGSDGARTESRTQGRTGTGTGAAAADSARRIAAEPALPARLVAKLDRFTLRSPGIAEPHVRGAGYTLSVRSEAPDLAGPPPTAEIRIVLPESEVPDLTVYNAYLPSGSGLAFESGSGRVGGWLRYSTAERAGSAALRLAADAAAARYRGLAFSGDLLVAARVPRFDPRSRRFDLAGTAAEITGARAGDGVRDWWGRFELPAGTLDLGADPGGGHRLDARFAGRARDSGPVVALFTVRRPVLRWFDGLLTVEDVAVSGHLAAGAETVAIRDLSVRGGDLAIRGRLSLAGGGHRGVYLARLGPLTAAVAASGDEREWKLRGAREWYQERVRSMPEE